MCGSARLRQRPSARDAQSRRPAFVRIVEIDVKCFTHSSELCAMRHEMVHYAQFLPSPLGNSHDGGLGQSR